MRALLQPIASVLLASVVCLTTGTLELGGHGCHCDDERGALLHEEHQHAPGEPVGEAHLDREHLHDVCAPFSGDCEHCSSCFHPVAVAAVHAHFVIIRFALGRPDHVIDVPAMPLGWEPAPPLHVPIAPAPTAA